MKSTNWQGCIQWDGEKTIHELSALSGQDVRFLRPDFTVDASAWRRAGYGPVSEILLILDRLEGRAAGASLLVSVSTRIIVETAKLWALRRLLGPVHITTIGDVRDLAPLDDGTNRVRTTVQSVVGVWGGADEVCVLPHNVLRCGFLDIDAARHALAVTRLLRHESRFADMARGLTGAEAIEAETARLIDEVNAWREGAEPVAERLQQDMDWLDGPRRPQDEKRVFVGVNQFI